MLQETIERPLASEGISKRKKDNYPRAGRTLSRLRTASAILSRREYRIAVNQTMLSATRDYYAVCRDDGGEGTWIAKKINYSRLVRAAVATKAGPRTRPVINLRKSPEFGRVSVPRRATFSLSLSRLRRRKTRSTRRASADIRERASLLRRPRPRHRCLRLFFSFSRFLFSPSIFSSTPKVREVQLLAAARLGPARPRKR